MTNQPLKYIADQVCNKWLRSHSGSLIESVYRLVGSASAIEVIYIEEYASGDWDAALCTGDPVQVWAYRGEEFQEVEKLGEQDHTNPIASRTPVIRYCLAEDGRKMIHTIWSGSRAGFGHIMHLTDDSWKSDGRKWIS